MSTGQSINEVAGSGPGLNVGLAGMVAEHAFNDKQRELYETMSNISENCYCAGWIIGNEYEIWQDLQTGNRHYGLAEIDSDALEKCRRLSQELGGWIVWCDADDEPNLPIEEWGPRFVPMAHWMEMVKANTYLSVGEADPVESTVMQKEET